MDKPKTAQQHLLELLDKGLTLTDIARKTGLPNSTVSYIKQGRHVAYDKGALVAALNAKTRRRKK